MPTRTRQRRGDDVDEPSSQILSEEASGQQDPAEVMIDEEMDESQEIENEGEDEDEEVPDDEPEVFPPPGLKEISSLASWTVSTAKPGNGVAALRSPDPSLFWQSDGPQPHLLSIHFFKLVSIVSIRILLDFHNDESYTPTKIQFLAGMGVHDLQEFAEMSFEQPTGWIDVDFSNVGPTEHDDDGYDDEAGHKIDWSKRPVLRAFLVQVRILENHQNGKDTHLRAVQLFARDEVQQLRETHAVERRADLPSRSLAKNVKYRESNNIKKASFMLEPDLR